SDADTPMGKELNPQKVFDDLVAAGASASMPGPELDVAAAQRRALDKSALDSLKASTQALQNRLSASDKRELELRVAGTTPLPSAACAPIARPQASTDGNQNPVERMGIMNDLIVMALQ